jgi:CDP-glucose 4,6-dehydratase
MTGFWQGRRVLVTGHTGFKGSWLSLWLQRLGAEVTGYALAPATDPALFTLARVDRGMDHREGDVRDLEALTRVLRQTRPEVVLHLAAQALVRDSYATPVETFHTNVLGTVNLLEAVRTVGGVRAAVVVTSDKCYENREWPWGYREDEAMGGHDPYSASKGCAELVAASYRRSFFPAERHGDHGLALATARAGNVIGGGDWAKDRLVPDILRAIGAGREVVIRSPGALRPWQHVLEPLAGYLALAEALFVKGPDFAKGWNFGPWDSDTRPVLGLVEGLTRAWGEGAGYRIEIPEGGVHEAHHLKLDISRARTELGWQPRWGLDTCLEAIVAWHRAHLAGADLRAVTLEQIRAFETPVS